MNEFEKITNYEQSNEEIKECFNSNCDVNPKSQEKRDPSTNKR
eukprot:CAMPEP_0170541822 /NCGR_PEP_ID=MMETSP0211-20121228/1445_1 /TAXON_ID=311385 /ORGANISM="Pseudokeronopsis sp., Strain OXSARD2" /LENGTH=42 /DNA_ID= /DNA_START= /DNA_END= /DNA_ORIENTATION=